MMVTWGGEEARVCTYIGRSIPWSRGDKVLGISEEL
jgi:hypothetical protein